MFRGILTGLGGRGLYWLGEVRHYSGCELVGYVEPLESNRQRAVRDHQVPESQIFTSIEEAVRKTKADFVLDVTPPAVHHKIAAVAFANGLHVIGEKPLSDDFAIARQVVEDGKKAGVRHMITQNYRFGSSPRTIRKLIAQDTIGAPGQFDMRFYMSWADIAGSHYVTQPYMLINDMMVHHFDMMRYVLGVEPVAVHAISWNHSWGWHKGDAAHAIVFEFPNGLHATHVSVGCAVGQMTSWNGDWRIEGPRGSITLENEQIRHVHRHRVATPIDNKITPLEVPPPGKALLDEFFGAIRENRDPECSAEDNLNSMAMVFAAIKSTSEKRRVELAELGMETHASVSRG